MRNRPAKQNKPVSGSVSVEPELLEAIDARAAELGLNRSQYLVSLAREDIAKGGPLLLVEKSVVMKRRKNAAAASSSQEIGAPLPTQGPELQPKPKQPPKNKKPKRAGRFLVIENEESGKGAK